MRAFSRRPGPCYPPGTMSAERPAPIEAVLLDAGMTLCYPATGNWFVPPGHEELFAALESSPGGRARLDAAFLAAYKVLKADHRQATEAEELALFLRYYATLLAALGREDPAGRLARRLAEACVLDDAKFGFYEDVEVGLRALAASRPLALVSDTWPSLERVFVARGLRRHFKAFVMSSVLGVPKPDPAIYRAALEALGVAPERAVFVDDSPRNLAGAAALGIRAVLIDRDWKHPAGAPPYPSVRDLPELMALLERMER